VKIHVPHHITGDWLAGAASQQKQARAQGKSTTLIQPQRLSIRACIALARQVKPS
jgi:hypothetical protein